MISGAPKKASLPLSLNTPFPLADAWNSRVFRALFLWFKALIPVETLVPLGGQSHYILSPRYTEIRRALKFSSPDSKFESEVKSRWQTLCTWEGRGTITWGEGGRGTGPKTNNVCVWPYAWLCLCSSHGGSCWTPFLNPLPENLIYAAFGAMEPDSPPCYSKIIAAGYSWEFSNSFKLESRSERWRKVLLGLLC